MTPLEIIIMKMWEMALVYIASTADSTHSTSVDTDRHLCGGDGGKPQSRSKGSLLFFPLSLHLVLFLSDCFSFS